VGAGWRALPDETNKTLSLSVDDIPYRKTYRLVVSYNDSITLQEDITVTNLLASYDFDIQKIEENGDIKL
jgi:hypothetical protein